MEILKTIQLLQSIGDCKEIDDAVLLIVQQGERIAELEAELIDERYRHDRVQDFEVAEAEELRKLKEQTRWIPVTERLPERGQDVIVFTGNILKPAVLAYSFWNPKYDLWERVTHWMPLPDGPKEG